MNHLLGSCFQVQGPGHACQSGNLYIPVAVPPSHHPAASRLCSVVAVPLNHSLIPGRKSPLHMWLDSLATEPKCKPLAPWKLCLSRTLISMPCCVFRSSISDLPFLTPTPHSSSALSVDVDDDPGQNPEAHRADHDKYTACPGLALRRGI